ncbi:MAG: hypothetical protein ISS53_03035 [Dehalococcoidia bacterium]|nr:hypothetical protein [Dehalococcoidia bacterium]
MDLERALELLRQYVDEIAHLKTLHYSNSQSRLWKNKVNVVLEAAFRKNSDEYRWLNRSASTIWSRTGNDREDYLLELKDCELGIRKILQKYEILGASSEAGPGKEVGKKEIDTVRALNLLERLLDETPRLKRLPSYNQEFEPWDQRVREILTETFGKKSNEYVRYDGILLLKRGKTAEDKQQAYVDHVTQREAALKSILQRHTTLSEAMPSSPKGPLQEAVYPSGKPYDAYKDIKDILTAAAEKLIIVDPYVDGTLFTMLENVQPEVQIQIMTQKMGGDFQLVGHKFKEQRKEAQQGTLEVRKSGKLHDRFIVVDNKIFHIGASIKDAGTKMCAMSEFEGADIKTALKKTVYRYWDEAETVL